MIGVKAFMRKMVKAKQDGYPFVLYRKPADSLVHAMIQKDRDLKLIDTFDDSGFVMAPFDTSKQAVLIAKNNANCYTCTAEEFPKNYNNSDNVYNNVRDNTDLKELHLRLVQKGINTILSDKVFKIVLSRKEEVVLRGFDIQVVFEALLSRYPSAFVYVWFHPKVGLWLGASPETLLKTEGARFSTMALAGTKKNQTNVEESWGKKEIREQQLVTDHIVNNLKSFSIKVGESYTKKAGSLLHICTDIEGKMNEGDKLSDLIVKLHPTAAVCGFPKNEAESFILQQENYDRSFYTGFLGELNFIGDNDRRNSSSINGKIHSNLFVNLRCMQILDDIELKAVLYIGGGITEESDPLSEWQETIDKSLVMKSVLGLKN